MEQKGTHEEHLSVLEFKKKECAKEVAELGNMLAEKQDHVQALDEILKENIAQLETLEAEKAEAEMAVDEAAKEAASAGKKATKAKKELQSIAPLVNNMKSYALDYGREADRLLPEAGTLESGKSYKEKKAIPFMKKMKDILFSLYLEYCKLQDKYQRLSRDYNDMWNKKERIHNRCNVLEKRVEELEDIEKDYGRIRKFFGLDRVDNLLRELKEQERLQAGMEKYRLWIIFLYRCTF